jgi:hypothetical protein
MTSILLPSKEFTIVNLIIVSTGDINGDDVTSAISTIINVLGSGNVTDIHTINVGIINVQGSRDVRVNACNSTNITKDKMGSGSIKVKQVK